ncbi:hypothetical protein KSZ_71380 [Dictyobacter formicarum]|uniref:Uncharacterized protein n=1 Tax=Dictyobacter formicarum TaxID=2778368 RepID=A0ABQ3VS67_9CHLR|nr:hypothetical protein KSZ_71380 [Dictyobacter formicarum]
MLMLHVGISLRNLIQINYTRKNPKNQARITQTAQPIGSGLAPDCRPPQRGDPVPAPLGTYYIDTLAHAVPK